MSTKIEWCEETWNPIIGCSKISSGCKNCYAERMAGRLANIQSQVINYGQVVEWKESEKGSDYPMSKWNGKTHFVESALEKPFKWKKPRRIFVCSMGDLFHESVPFEWIERVWKIMAMCTQHTFLVLTKRPERIIPFFKYVGNRVKKSDLDSVPTQSENPFDYINTLPNVWIGVTAENQKMADKRIPIFLKVPAAKRFVSIEPMLGPVDLTSIKGDAGSYYQVLEPIKWAGVKNRREAIDWVIIGSESGPNRRWCIEKWVEDLIKQCEMANVPIVVKQLHRNGKKVALPEINGKIYNEYPK